MAEMRSFVLQLDVWTNGFLTSCAARSMLG